MRKRRKQKARGRRPWRILLGALLALFGCTLGVWEIFFLRLSELRNPKEVRSLTVAAGGHQTRRLILGPANPYWTPRHAISDTLVLCVLRSEDDGFYRHSGFDWKQLRSAMETNLETGRYVRGASTITMQLAKNLFLWRQKSVARKILEAYLTWRLEQTLTKDRILELYLNAVEWGPGLYGIGEASHHYFGKPPSDLTLGESALLAAILPNPVKWNPQRAPELALRKQRDLLARLRRENALDRLANGTLR